MSNQSNGAVGTQANVDASSQLSASQQQAYFSHLDGVRKLWWQESVAAAAVPPPPALFLPMERLLATQSIDAALSAKISDAKRAALASSVSDITRGSALLEPGRSIATIGSNSLPSASPTAAPNIPPAAAASPPSIASSSTHQAAAVLSSNTTPQGPQASPSSLPHVVSARRNPWDDEDTDQIGKQHPDDHARVGTWDKAVANALASLEEPGASQPQPAAASSPAVPSIQMLQQQIQQLQLQHHAAKAQPQPSVHELQAQLQQLQLLHRKQEELRTLQTRIGLATPPSPSSPTAAMPVSLSPQAPLHELQRANLRRSSSSSLRLGATPGTGMGQNGAAPHLAAMTMSRSALVQTQASGLGGGSIGTSVVSSADQSFVSVDGSAGRATRGPIVRTASKRGAYPDFVLQSAADSQVYYGRDSEERHSAPSGTRSHPGREKRHTHTSGMSEEPWGGSVMARGFAAITSFKRRETAGAHGLSGTPSDGNLRSQTGVTVSGLEQGPGARVLSHSLSNGSTAAGSSSGGGSGTMLFPAYVRPTAADSPGRSQHQYGSGSGGSGRQHQGGVVVAAAEVPSRARQHLAMHPEEGEEEGEEERDSASTTGALHINKPLPDGPAPIQPWGLSPTGTHAVPVQQGLSSEGANGSSGGAAGNVSGVSSSHLNGGSSSGGGARAFTRTPSFGAAAGSGKFRVKPQLIDPMSVPQWSPRGGPPSPGAIGLHSLGSKEGGGSGCLSSPTSLMVPAARASGSGVLPACTATPGADVAEDAYVQPQQGVQSLPRAQQRSALGSHQILITMQDFVPQRE